MKGGFPLAILVNLDVMMAKRKVSAGELAERIGITPANLSILKNNKAQRTKGRRFSLFAIPQARRKYPVVYSTKIAVCPPPVNRMRPIFLRAKDRGRPRLAF